MLRRLFKQASIPEEYRSNFVHLYMDVFWFGVLSGSGVNFLSIYATRIGASSFQIGLISAMSAVVTLFLSIPTGRWLQTQNTGRAIFWSSIYYRVGYLAFIFLPWLPSLQGQIWSVIAITFLMAIPLTTIGVGFNALFAEAVPVEYRAHVAGIRNVTLSITYMVSSLVSGYLLRNIEFPLGYQIIFAIGAIGAGMSSYHLYYIRPLKSDIPVTPMPAPLTLRPYARTLATTLRLDIWKTRFRNVLLGLFAFHLTQYLPIPIFPLYNVHVLKLTDDHIGVGTALFYLTVLLGSTQLGSMAHRIGNKKLTAFSVSLLGLYPLLLAFSTTVWHYYGVSLVGGLVFAMVSGSYANYMLEHIPAHDRPPHLAWYSIVLNLAVLIGSLAGSATAEVIGLSSALLLFGGLRVIAGMIILKWG